MTQPRDAGLMRTDDAERSDAREVLGRHFSAGRLDYGEYEDRIGLAMAARTRADLWELFTDLPYPHPRSLSAEGGPDEPPVAAGPATPQLGPPQLGPPSGTQFAPQFGPPRYPGFVAAPMYALDVPAPFGFEPQTGRPYSDKQKVTAGLLQVFLGCFGVGRFYAGHTGIGLAQLLITVLTFGLLSPITVVWGLIDGILMLTGSSSDSRGRPLR